MTLYEQLSKLVKPDAISHRYSDIHVKRTPEVMDLLKKHFGDLNHACIIGFTNQITKESWIEVAGGYTEYFDHLNKPNKSEG